MANLHTYKPLTIINIGMRNKIHDNKLCIFHAYYTTWSQMNIRRKGTLGDVWASAHHSLISGPKEPGSLAIYSVHSPSFKTRGRSILRTLVSTTNLLPQHGVPSTLFLTHITPPETHFLSESTDRSLTLSIAEPFVVWNSWGVNFYSR